MEKSENKKYYPIGAEHYTLYEEVGQGVSASVHRALCIPLKEIVAIKILDFERDKSDLNKICRESQTMILVDHPNVLKSHCSFVSDHNLWVVMPYMAGGSCLHILKAAYPDGFEEVVIATVLRDVLKGLAYLHDHGQIHRDVKAGNILIDARGGIKLGDFGVSACLFDSYDRQRMRSTFVGTPCWMAPEVMEQLRGYDFKADIWSFGITALELAHGHAPFSKYPPMKVLLMTLQNAPPGLDYEKDRKFSKSFKQMITTCLVKDPSRRPSAEKLLKHSFFKQARSNDYIARTLLDGLPALGDRLKALQKKEKDLLAQKKISDGKKEEMSQNEYKRGISGWNFNVDDVKAQASLIPNEDSVSDKDQIASSNSFCRLDMPEKKLHRQLSSASQVSVNAEDNYLIQNQPAPLLQADSTATYTIAKCEKSDDDVSITSSTYERQVSQNSSPQNDNPIGGNMDGEAKLDSNGIYLVGMTTHSYQREGRSSGSISLPDAVFTPYKGESDKLQNQFQNILSCNGTPIAPITDDGPSEIISRSSKTSANSDELDDKTKCPVVHQKGRFKVTSENVDLEKVVPSPMLQKSHSMQEGIYNIMKQVSAGDSRVDGRCMPINMAVMEKTLLEAAHDREKELLHERDDLQWRLICAQEEIKKYKTENTQVKF